jgi:glutamate-1-semialdehyde 2,1-aminomutase
VRRRHRLPLLAMPLVMPLEVSALSARAACRGAARVPASAARVRTARCVAASTRAAFSTKRSDEVRRARDAASRHTRVAEAAQRVACRGYCLVGGGCMQPGAKRFLARSLCALALASACAVAAARRPRPAAVGKPRWLTRPLRAADRQLMAEAKNLLPGGVNSPVRAFKSVGGGPIVFDRVKGAYAFDVDGNKYIDYVGSWGPAICGHANDQACVCASRACVCARLPASQPACRLAAWTCAAAAARAACHSAARPGLADGCERAHAVVRRCAPPPGERRARQAAGEGNQLRRALRAGGACPLSPPPPRLLFPRAALRHESVALPKWVQLARSQPLLLLTRALFCPPLPCFRQNELAKVVIDAVPSVEMVRFVNSGTEACLSVLRVMRAYTGRDKVIKFEGCYHGHADAFLVQAGSGVVTLGLPDSPGVPAAVTAPTLCAPYNDLEAVKALFKAHKGEIAGVILEPVVGNSGFIVPDRAFLEGLREVTKAEGALLCFDEVMTGFRISYGCAQKYWGVTPDLTTMGKVIGGGLPVGAYGGRRDIMEVVAPAGPMYQAGTLSGNPLAMTAGLETLRILRQPGSYEHLERVTKRLITGLLEEGKKAGHAMCGGNISGMFGFFFCEGPVRNFQDATRSDLKKFARWHRGMLERGVYLAPSQYEAGFTSLAHTDADVDATLAAAREVFKTL